MGLLKGKYLPSGWEKVWKFSMCHMKLTGLACNTYYKYKRQIQEEQDAAKSMRQME